ncbi:MAG: hypothetical protein J6Q24_00055 [Clostridia bacterium]|nr:hypothetical protein [Clostridia bacterium]
MEEKRKSEARLWLEHLWWSHKWMIISIALIIALVIFAVVSCSRNDEPDVNILYVGPLKLSVSVQDLLQNSLQDMIPDTNGDGEKLLSVQSIAAETRYENFPILGEGDYVSNGEIILADPSADVEYSQIIVNADLDSDTREQFNMAVTIGDSVIYFMEEYYFDLAMAMKVIAPLDTVLDPENMPENPRDEYSVYLKDLDISSLPGFDTMPDDVIVCIRRFPNSEAGELLYGRTKEQYNANVELFNKLFAYKD